MYVLSLRIQVGLYSNYKHTDRVVSFLSSTQSQLLKKERERRRLQRLVQVREQSKCFAKHVREEYKKLCTKEKEQHENQFMVLTYSKYSCWAVIVLVTSIALDVVLNT